MGVEFVKLAEFVCGSLSVRVCGLRLSCTVTLRLFYEHLNLNVL